ncbi:MAG: glycosyltransferase family 4 protein [Pseudomonas palmensis]|uniref:glycosyltransferase family 4 protein n=1 Tax=Pseudomonas palmensis TaxID=2815362 RepID=UPI003D0FE338
MLNKPSSILCLHQGSELYGSDRSFLAAVETFSDAGLKQEVILPANGLLALEVGALNNVDLSFYAKGILRKNDLKRKPITFFYNTLLAVFFYIKRFRNHPIIYINTVVMFSALLAACFYRFSSKRIICHVREIPAAWQLHVFRLLFNISGVELVFNSNATKQAFGIAGRVIYNGVAKASAPEIQLSIDDGSDVGSAKKLLLIGRINDWKGQFFLVDTLHGLPVDKRSQLKVRIVGSPFEGYEYLTGELKRKVEVFGLSNIVELIPFCQDPSAHYRWADYVIVPSILPEPFGRVAIEAFSYAKPVLAANHGGLVEIVENGSSGFLFPPADEKALAAQIASLLDITPAQYSSLSQNASARYENLFSIEGYRANLLSLLTS